jgi:hypothetical protein
VPGGGATRGNDIGSLIVVWMSVPARLEDQPLGVVLAGLLTLSSVTAGIGRTPAVTASGTLNCRDPIGTEDRLPANNKVAGRAVALLTGLPGRRALGAGRVSEALLPSHRYWSKTPLHVRTRKAAEIGVPRREPGRIAMTWRNTASDPLVDRTFSVGPCPGPVGWIVFPGGYYVTRPGCSTLLVRVDSTDAPVRLRIGAPCTGKW